MATINHKTYNEATETFKDFNVYDGKETLIFKVDGSEGNVGIGNSSPTATLDITGTLAVSGNSTFDTTTLVVDAAGDRVILGAAASLEGDTIEIHAKGNAGAISLFGRASDNGSAVSFRSNGATTQKAQIYGSDTGLGFATGTTQRVLIDTSGNVGIGTSAPAAKLEIFGTGNTLRLDSAANGAKEILFRNVGNQTATIRTDGDLKFETEDSAKFISFFTNSGGGSSEKMRITSTGNVGIGTTSPATKLDVAFPSRWYSGCCFWIYGWN
jgi:trimeric autotransporter adhesin